MTPDELRISAEAHGLSHVVTEPRGDLPCVRGTLVTRAGPFELRIVLPQRFPSELPVAWLVDPPADRRGHIMAEGALCWTRRDVLVDRHRPDRIVAECLDACRRLLELSPEESEAELMDEIESFWGELPGAKHAVVELDEIDVPRRLYRAQIGRHRWTTRSRTSAGGQLDPGGVVVPLVAGAFTLPPRNEALDASWVRRLLREHVDPVHRVLVDELLGRPSPHGDLVVLSVPRRTGARSLLGVWMRGKHGRHPLDGGRAEVRPVLVERHDQATFLPPNDQSTTLGRARVAVVGIGAVGGHVAQELARAGIGALTVVDPDFLQARNVYRHVLGATGLGLPKASMLAARLRLDAPYITVVDIPGRVEDAIAANLLDLRALDAVVIAVDAPSTALWLHAQMRAVGVVRVGVMTWLEPMGIAAHSLLFPSRGAGCMECLYTDADTGDFRECAFHLAAAGQDFDRDIVGCARADAVSSLDALRAADLAVRHVISGLTRESFEAELVTWRGDTKPFTAAGFKLSGRAHGAPEIIRYRAIQLARSSCRICGS